MLSQRFECFNGEHFKRALSRLQQILGFIALGAVSSLGWGAEPRITAIESSPDGSLVLVGSQKGVELKAATDLKKVQTIQCDFAAIHDLQFSPSGRELAIAGGDPGRAGVIRIVTWPKLEEVFTSREPDDVLYSVAWHPSTSMFVAASWDKSCYVFEKPSDESTYRFSRKYAGHSAPVLAIAFVDESSVISAGMDETLQQWNPIDGRAIRNLHQHTAEVHSLMLAPSSENTTAQRLLASASSDKTVRFWDTKSGRMIRFQKFKSVPRSIAWKPLGTALWVGLDDGQLIELDSQTLAQRPLESTTVHTATNPVIDMAVDPSKSLLVREKSGVTLMH